MESFSMWKVFICVALFMLAALATRVATETIDVSTTVAALTTTDADEPTGDSKEPNTPITTGLGQPETGDLGSSKEDHPVPLHQHHGKQEARKPSEQARRKIIKEFHENAHKHRFNAKELPIPDIRALKEFVEQAKDYEDGTLDMSWFNGPTKTCKRKKAAVKGKPDDVEIVVSYPHPLSDEDRKKMESMSQAYWGAVGVDPRKDEGPAETAAPAGSDDEDKKVYFERVIEETEEEEIEV